MLQTINFLLKEIHIPNEILKDEKKIFKSN